MKKKQRVIYIGPPSGHVARAIEKILNSENPQDVSDSPDTSGDLNTGYQMECEADGSTDTSESVTVPLPKRIDSESRASYLEVKSKYLEFLLWFLRNEHTFEYLSDSIIDRYLRSRAEES